MRNWMMTGTAVAVALAAGGGVARAQDKKAADVLAQARAALGGEAKVQAVQALELTTNFKRAMAGDQMDGYLELQLQRPDRLRITDEMTPIPGGPTVVRIQGLNAGEAWDDSTTRGGGGGNIVMHMQMAGGDRPDDPAVKQQRLNTRRADLQRYLAGLLASPTIPAKYAGVAESDDGKADIVEIAPEGGAPMQLFVDQQSHLPLMLTYKGRPPRVMVNRVGPGGPPPNREQMAREAAAAAAASPEVTFELRFGEHKAVEGVKLPFRITRSVGGAVVEEWTVEKYKINPVLKAESFQKK